jgi:hypothetical protein
MLYCGYQGQLRFEARCRAFAGRLVWLGLLLAHLIRLLSAVDSLTLRASFVEVSEARSDWVPDPAHPLPKFSAPCRVPKCSRPASARLLTAGIARLATRIGFAISCTLPYARGGITRGGIASLSEAPNLQLIVPVPIVDRTLDAAVPTYSQFKWLQSDGFRLE